MNPSFGGGGRGFKDHAFAIVPLDADGDEVGAVASGGIDASLDVGGVKEELETSGSGRLRHFSRDSTTWPTRQIQTPTPLRRPNNPR